MAEGAANGTAVGITAVASDPDGQTVTYSLTNNAGGRFAIDSNSGVVTVANGSLLDGPASHTIIVQASDGDGGTSTQSFTIAVINVAPTARNNTYSTPQTAAVSGNVITDGTADSDPAGSADPLTVSGYTQPSNGTVTVAADGTFTYSPASTFSGTDSFTYTISDGDGGTATATVSIMVNSTGSGTVTIVPDTCLGGTALLIRGTALGDNIVVTPSGAGTLSVTINGSSTTVPIPSGRIIVFGGAGDDNIQLAGAINNPAWLYGEGGDDRLNNGGGGGLLFGGDGNDQLTGGSGRDIMVGGQGADRLVGNPGDDILIAGFTLMDGPGAAGHEEFWCEVSAEWNSTNNFLDRVNNLRGAATQMSNAHNVGMYLLPQVQDDNSTDQIDILQGSSGDDWFIYIGGEDRVNGQQEAVN